MAGSGLSCRCCERRIVSRISNQNASRDRQRTFCVVDNGEMRCLNIVVTSGGQIRMCDPAVASGDSRAC